MDNIISKFSSHLKSVLTRALTLVIEQKGNRIEPTHLFWALGTEQGSVGREVLLASGIADLDIEDIATLLMNKQGAQAQNEGVPILSDISKTAIEKAVLAASQFEHRYIGTEHLLFGLLECHVPFIEEFFEEAQLDPHATQHHLEHVFRASEQIGLPTNETRPLSPIESLLSPSVLSERDEEESKTPALDYFTVELTQEETAKDIDPVIGREHEIERLMKIVSRRTKNNPILVGEPGVGKTAIVEGLAKRIAEGVVPSVLRDKRIFRLDLASLVAGTMYRGEFESRLKQLIEEIEEIPEAILFIDEVHSVMGAGAASGSLDAANMLKPALARGTIRCIGATTPAEYKKYIETDGALERRFQCIRVPETSLEKTREILYGVKPAYEAYHGVTYTTQAIESALTLAERFLTEKQFPDKAIDLLDEAGAAASVRRVARTTDAVHRSTLEKDLEKLEIEKTNAVAAEDFRTAIEIKQRILATRSALAKTTENQKEETLPITDHDIMTVVAEMTGIPALELTTNEKFALSELSTRLEQHVIGQGGVVEHVSRSIVRAKLGFAHPTKPLTSFLFVGPTGVGKTELAKAIAKEVFRDAASLLRLDMSEFSSAFTVSKLLGSPAGYVGYRENALLSDFVKLHPHSVIVFDEIEKAHPEVIHLLLQILDEGVVTDATGRTVSFRNCIVILTSNIGSALFEQGGLGFEEGVDATEKQRETRIFEAVREQLSRELTNRLQHCAVFSPLSKDHLILIAKKQMAALEARLKSVHVTLNVDKAVFATIANQTPQNTGGRGIARTIESLIEHPVAELLLTTPNDKSITLQVKPRKGGGVNILHKKG